jgi:glutamate-5-semialdehyde dehydrogenase
MSDLERIVREKAQKAKEASQELRKVSSQEKNKGLLEIAQLLKKNYSEILKVNQDDIQKAEEANLDKAFIDRLTLTSARLDSMVKGVEEVVALPDPAGEITEFITRPNGLRVGKMRVPLGVIGLVYESRPNVTVDAAALCLKSGNALILRGGREAINSNKKLVEIMKEALLKIQTIPPEAIQFIDVPSREAVEILINLPEFVDVIIPRASQKTIKFLTERASVPVIAHGEGNCHLFIDDSAEIKKAVEICLNAKLQRPGVCNAVETLLIHRAIAPKVIPELLPKLKKAGVEIRGCEETRRLFPEAVPATEEDWRQEYLALILAVKIVKDLSEAISHVTTFGSGHSDGIITENYTRAMQFIREVDSAACYVNASTRFTDGYEFGLGAEIGISTQKLHARGPMGLRELTTFKYIILGDGQIRT